MRTYKFRIYPSKKQVTQMKEHLWIEKNLWNMLLEANKKKYDETKKFLTKNEMQTMVKDSGLYSQVAQTLSHRLQKALWRMVKMRKQGKECGYPRFKSIDRIKSLNYPQAGFSLDKKLKATPFGEINIKKHREIEGKIKTLTLKRESSGKWFATFCIETEPQTPKINQGEQVGIDLGLTKFAVLSNKEVIKNPRHPEQYEKKLALLQQRLSKKKKGSKNRKRAKHRVALLHEKVANTRTDFLHKTSTRFVNTYSLIALEKLASKEMSEQNFGKQINDAGWNTFANMISYKAESAGCKIVFVDPKNTTKMCSNCGELVEKELSERVHNCPSCGLSIDRDLNAARNILIRATVGQTGSNACGDVTTVPSLKQEAHIL
ncbi:MAG: IS200/IS605 family element transposase accessory protein TnpB [Candidatus Aenigmarchaeota archaeon]|nr:IS200/IS605 family element transposase accessory protein TnpB [Candidatus Aenigmarchaeota archaeon]